MTYAIHMKMLNGIHDDILSYNAQQTEVDAAICNTLATTIHEQLQKADNKKWHGHPVWFLDGNPIVGYSKEKKGVRLMFWSGSDFAESSLTAGTGKFKDASVFYTSVDQIDIVALQCWLEKSKVIQWDYKNIVKRKGVLIKM